MTDERLSELEIRPQMTDPEKYRRNGFRTSPNTSKRASCKGRQRTREQDLLFTVAQADGRGTGRGRGVSHDRKEHSKRERQWMESKPLAACAADACMCSHPRFITVFCFLTAVLSGTSHPPRAFHSLAGNTSSSPSALPSFQTPGVRCFVSAPGSMFCDSAYGSCRLGRFSQRPLLTISLSQGKRARPQRRSLSWLLSLSNKQPTCPAGANGTVPQLPTSGISGAHGLTRGAAAGLSAQPRMSDFDPGSQNKSLGNGRDALRPGETRAPVCWKTYPLPCLGQGGLDPVLPPRSPGK